MKKSILGIAIVLFVALFTFVGCEKDKSAEVLSTYEEYLKSSGGASDFSYVSMRLLGLQGEDKKITKEDIPLPVANELASYYYEDRDVTEIVSAEGVIDEKQEIKDDVSTSSISASGVKIKYKYNTVKLDEDGNWELDEEDNPVILKENLEDTFVLSGKLNLKLEGKKNLISMSCSGIVVDKVSFADVEASAYLSTGKPISCKVNGRDVPLTLIENMNVLENLINSIF